MGGPLYHPPGCLSRFWRAMQLANSNCKLLEMGSNRPLADACVLFDLQLLIANCQLLGLVDNKLANLECALITWGRFPICLTWIRQVGNLPHGADYDILPKHAVANVSWIHHLLSTGPSSRRMLRCAELSACRPVRPWRETRYDRRHEL